MMSGISLDMKNDNDNVNFCDVIRGTATALDSLPSYNVESLCVHTKYTMVRKRHKISKKKTVQLLSEKPTNMSTYNIHYT